MNAPSLQRLAVFSFFFHITLFAAGFLAAGRQSTHFAMPSPYVVNLVADSAMQQSAAPAPAAKQIEDQVPAKETSVPSPQKEDKRAAKKDEQKFREKLAAMEVKNKALKLAELRKRVKDISAKESRLSEVKGSLYASLKGRSESAAASGPAMNDYISNAAGVIKGQFEVPPEIQGKKLKTIVSVKIMTDGSIQIKRVQSSGNLLLDRKAQKAIKMASPLPRPPYEMEEMDLAFCPTEKAKCEW